uniref:FAD dependent oxidoreductase domain-containing protein n=1 Tax=Chromera velia CCMP2878 TaxID=1169474 RepID=A0A0G4GI24_9ALVE|eukprot:Cvel_21916.t1-p1 / transcript=Cvel_21916.t1 / gene=Cvel_21916 / organism=Chromera_velia_CCMP2878 / gene_product=Putative oxidoreductase C1F5.03c, putative / transcript_product=Putative oxidoreductase C1F5.03c, putative / location=Cvel_scaffold2100:31171-33681(-) / protein_length=392 / sequence_SO=supercontig / SO=protein_coding / is_pseudo=false
MASESEKSGGAEDLPVIVCGGGVIGCALAYFLTEKKKRVVIVEQERIAAAASGRAGGFLALDWCDSDEVGPLARASFRLHAELSEQLAKEGHDTLYRRVDTLALSIRGDAPLPEGAAKKGSLPAWLNRGVRGVSKLGTQETTAQVQPRLFTEALFDVASKRGASLRKGSVTGLLFEDSSSSSAKGEETEVAGVLVDGEPLRASQVVLAMGPWTCKAAEWLKGAGSFPRVTGQRYHSILMRPKEPITGHACFCNDEGKGEDFEIYPRSNNDVYVCGSPDFGPLPDHAGLLDACVEEERVALIKALSDGVSDALRECEVEERSCCWLPFVPDNIPMMGKVPGVRNLFASTGHGCWGILNGPASGLAMAELLVDGESKSLNLHPFSPSRFATTIK